MSRLNEILNYQIFTVGNYTLTLSHLVTVLIVFLFAKILIWIVTRALKKVFARRRIDSGKSFALTQLAKYLLYLLTFFLIIQALGIQISILLGAGAALMVGVGLGLQQTFNDFISGIILLMEGSVEVGDIIEVDGDIGRVLKISGRTSLVEMRDWKTVIVPNSKITVNNVVNWSHYNSKGRFNVNVGVAYGTDPELVQEVLLEIANNQDGILDQPTPMVNYSDFGESSKDFSLIFWSKDYLQIEHVKSDIRFQIDQKFKERGINIPFPQRDIWIRSGNKETFSEE